MENVIWKDIETANCRIKDCKQRREIFVRKYNETNDSLYKKLAESETDMIKEINDEICKAIAYLTMNGITE